MLLDSHADVLVFVQVLKYVIILCEKSHVLN